MLTAVMLNAAPAGTEVVLGRPDLPPDRARRLAELGLRAGARVVPLHRTAGGGRLVAVDDTRIALDKGTLRAFPVHPAQEQS